ncbi:MAG: metallophosphoesterase [Thermoanaerobaculia bacterium]|nr:metallophosphoesterase [Thermoanaerobaculia bacterium]
MPVRVLFLSDTHLGLDLPSRPRVERRRRGDDLFESFERALAPALSGEAGIVVHGGDLFYRSRIPAWLAERVFARLSELAEMGLDLFWVPGNHERSGVPRGLLLTHPRIRVFDRPRTFVVRRDGLDLAISGFPFAPDVRASFPALLAATGHADAAADIRLLCLHQAVEGAKVGPVGFTFRDGADVVRGRDVPAGFAAVLSGHIHRAQVLARDLAGRPLASPVLFAGSTDRTSFGERNEAKGTYLLALDRTDRGGSASWEFREVPVRPMVDVELDPGDDAASFAARLRAALAPLEPESLVRLRLSREPSPAVVPLLGAEALRRAAPSSMTVSVAWRDA